MSVDMVGLSGCVVDWGLLAEEVRKRAEEAGGKFVGIDPEAGAAYITLPAPAERVHINFTLHHKA